jgi:NADH-quinone oxidoreductase subunit A
MPGKGIAVIALLSLLVASLLLVAGLYGASVALSVSRQPAMSLPFESGMAPTQHAVSRFHARWYAVTVLFLAFDMEMVFMYPWAVVVADMGTTAVVEMFGFLAVLFVGVVYVWREGALRWS